MQEPTAPPATERRPAWQGRMCRSSRCGLPPRGEFWPLPSSLLHILSGTAWAPGRPARTAGPRAVARGATLLWGWATRVEFPVPGGPPTSAPWGCPGWSGSSVRGLAGNVHGREGPWHRANWRATHPGGMGVLRRPASAATDREGSGGPAHGPPPATAPTMQRGPRAPFLDIPCVCTRARCAPSPFAPSLLPGPSSPLSPPGLGQKPFGPRAPQPGCRAGPAARGLAPTGGSRRQGPLQGPVLPCPGPRPPSLPRTAPSSPANWPVASPRPPHPPAPAPVAAAAAALHPTPYTLHPTSYTLHPTDGATTSRAQPPNSNSTHNSRVESSSGVQLGSCDTLGPQRACTVARVRRLLTDSPAPLGHGRCLPTPAGPAPGPGGRPTPRLSGSHHRPPTGQSGPRWRTPCGLPDGHARLPTGREPLGRQPAPRQLTGDDVPPSASANWPARQDMPRNAAGGHRGLRSPASPLQAPGAAGGDDGEVCLHKSSQGSG